MVEFEKNEPAGGEWQRPEVLEMYEVSGQDRISEHSYGRYLRDRERWGEKIDSLAQGSLSYWRDRFFLCRDADEAEKCIADGLESDELALDAARLITFMPEWKVPYLIKQATKTGDLEVVNEATKFISSLLSEKSQESISSSLIPVVKEGLSSDEVRDRQFAVRLSIRLDDKQRDALAEDVERTILAGFESNDINELKGWIPSLHLLKEADAWDCEEKIIDSGDMEAIELLSYANYHLSEQDYKKKISAIEGLIRERIESGDQQDYDNFFNIFYFFPDDTKERLARQATRTQEPEALKFVAAISTRIGSYKLRAKLLGQVLDSDDLDVFSCAATLIEPRNDWRPLKPDQVIGLKEKVYSRVVELSGSEDDTDLRLAAQLIEFVPDSKKSELIESFIESGNSEHLVAPELYTKDEPDPERFDRVEFEKTGSRTVLLGGSLHSKVITRIVEPYPFSVWQTLYEDYQVWQSIGFDYVPIEPIISFRLTKDEQVAAQSGVLDLSFKSYKTRFNTVKNFIPELKEDIEKLGQALDDLGVEHGHLREDNNFNLRFFRDDNGEIDFNRKPRIYIIDCDRIRDVVERDFS